MAEEKKTKELGYVKPREIVDEVSDSYIDYAMSVIVSRALPDARDGLKPVHRRILYAMHEMGLGYNTKFRKSASVVGSVLARYHPHGDQAVYDSMARMTQDFSLRYPLIQGQGNWGSIDDPSEFAAMRYTECRLSKIGQEMLKDIERDTINFRDNYDATKKEPVILPSPLPQLLLNGSLGIAVGMATNMLPHNLSEVCDAVINLVDNPDATTKELFEWIKGPDFPTGGIIYNQKEIISAYSQGKGPIVCRGKADISESKKTGRTQIVISEIPYQVKKTVLVEQLAALVQNKRIDGIKDIRDESDREGLRIVIDLKKGGFPQKILNRLYKWSDLQKTFHLNMLALIDGIQPQVLSLSELLSYYLSHRKEVVTRRTKFNLDKAKERAHILEGLAKALSKIDRVISIIRSSKDKEEAKKKLIKFLKLTEIQALAILEIKLHQLAKMEHQKIKDELKEKLKEIKELADILKSPKKIKTIIKKELEQVKAEYGDPRRTKVVVQAIGEFSLEDLIPQEDTIITLTQSGYMKRINPDVYKLQKRGGKGILGMKTMGEDIVEHFVSAKTHDFLLFFTDSGKVFRTPVYEVPEGTRVAKGRGLLNFLEISSQEKVLSLIPIRKEDLEQKEICLLMVTKKGIIKKTRLQEFENVRRSGLRAINLKKGDSLKSVKKTSSNNDIILITKKGQSIRFKEKEIRPMGRSAAGVKGIRLNKEDEVIGLEVIKDIEKKAKNFLLIITNNGYGKRSFISEYKVQGRGGTGIKTARVVPKTGNLVSSKILTEEEELIVVSRKGIVIKTKIKSIPKLGRATQGVKIMKLGEGDSVASTICI